MDGEGKGGDERRLIEERSDWERRTHEIKMKMDGRDETIEYRNGEKRAREWITMESGEEGGQKESEGILVSFKE